MAEMITVKLSFEGQFRRFPVDGSSFNAMYDQIVALLGLEKDAELVLKYTDEQGDLITMSSDMELKAAIVKDQLLRITAAYKEKSSTTPAVSGEENHCRWFGWGAVDKDSKKEFKKRFKEQHKLHKKMWKGARHASSFGPHHGPFARGPCGRPGAFEPHHGPFARGPFGPHHGPFGRPGAFGPHHGPLGGQVPFGPHHGPFGRPGAFGPHRGPFGPHARGPFGHCNPEKFARLAKEGGLCGKGMWKAEKFALYVPLVDAVLANEHLQSVKRKKVFRMLRKFDGDKDKVIDALTKKMFKKAEKLTQLGNEAEKHKKATSTDLMAF